MPREKGNSEEIPALRRLRQEAGLKQAELAKQIPDKTRNKNLNQSVISRWESGEDEPELTVVQMKALCRALGKCLEELTDDFGPPKQSKSKDNKLFYM